jgi:DNA-directed RNA polymerase alpha subunit
MMDTTAPTTQPIKLLPEEQPFWDAVFLATLPLPDVGTNDAAALADQSIEYRRQRNPSFIKSSELLDDSIDKLDINGRAYNALVNAGVFTINQLIKMSAIELRRKRNCGKKTIIVIRAALKKIGLSLVADGPYS